MIVGAAMSMQISPIQLLTKSQSVKGWYSGTSIDSEDTLSFSAQTGVRSMNEVFPLEKAGEAYQRMMNGEARFRAVLDMEK
jgi:D-arabinose 1-dehydrogenase-like Zn-dependent alcohol dehydrogenase